MENIPNNLENWLNPEDILIYGGFWLLLFVIFAESGLFFGFFLPGDSLLFTAGVFCGTRYLPFSLVELFCYISLVAVVGYVAGYLVGRLFSNWLMHKQDSFVFKRRFLERTMNYYEEKHEMAIILGRFLPIIRSFIPVLAGIIPIKFSRFMVLNVLGTEVWVFLYVFSGYFLSRLFPQIYLYYDFVIIGMILITTIPALFAIHLHQKST